MGKRPSALGILKMLSERRAHIEAALPFEPTGLPWPNKLAAALHPGTQYLRVAEAIEEDARTKSYILEPDPARGTETLAWFSAGQYLSIRLRIGDAVLTRPFSLSSAPRASLDGRYRISVRAVEGGMASRHILDRWSVGTAVEASEPLGDFTYEPLRDAGTVVGLAGGSGVTPFCSLAHAIADGDEDASLILLYGSRTMEDAMLREELRALEAACPRFRLIHVLSEGAAPGAERGLLTADLIRKYAPEGEYSVFAAGPRAMYGFLDGELEKLGLRRRSIRREPASEIFCPEREPDYPADAAAAHTVTVRLAGTERTIEAAAGESLLRAMEKNGIAAPSHCRSGECGWCRSRLVSGEVYIPRSADGRREADRLYGYIHPCCTFPMSDLTIDVPPAG